MFAFLVHALAVDIQDQWGIVVTLREELENRLEMREKAHRSTYENKNTNEAACASSWGQVLEVRKELEDHCREIGDPIPILLGPKKC